MAKPKAPPLNPVTDAHLAEFDQYVSKWRALLNLRDWRILRHKRKRSRELAEVTEIHHEHKLARYSVGTDFGEQEVTAEAIESTALHELMHILIAPVIATAIAEGEDNDAVLEVEHAVIIVLCDLLMHAYGDKPHAET